jgi:hypothetical protein
MKAHFFVLVVLLFSFKGFSQFEIPKRTINIAPVRNTSGSISPSSSKVISYPSIFEKKDKLLQSVSSLKKKPVEEKSVMELEQFENPAKEHTEKMNKMMAREGLSREIVNSDMFLGEFIIFTENLYISCRDNGAIDGDNVSVWLNGERVLPFIGLESGFKKFEFNLKKGINILEIEALNTGELFPNTGQFVFFDGNEKLVTNQNWDLNSGFKAVIKIQRLEGIEPEKK